MRADPLTEQIWPQCPGNNRPNSELPCFSKAGGHQSLSLLLLPVQWDSNNLQGKVTLPTSTSISPGSVPEKHHAAQQELKAGVQSLAEPRP